MNKTKDILNKYKESILYLLFGGCSVIVNIVVYYISAHIFELSTVISNIIAWIIAVIFAYITNKIWVFESKSWNKEVIFDEVPSFFTFRIITGIIDIAIMFIFVDKLYFNDMIVKVISNIIVIILNYLASKFIVFKKK